MTPLQQTAPLQQPAAIQDAGQLCDALGIRLSEQQLAAVTAPLAPGVVLAGAGSGKTTVMAARVVWLVGTGQVLPEQVLGLTFTRKAAAQLGHRVAAALADAGLSGAVDSPEPDVLTYDAFAARLVTEHGVRLGIDSGRRMIADATRYRLAARVVERWERPLAGLSRLAVDGVVDKVLRLDQELSQHLVGPDVVREFTREYLVDLDQAPTFRGNPYSAIRAARAAAEERLELLGLVEGYRQVKADLGLVEFADQMALAADLVERAPGVGKALRRQYPVVLLDEYQDTSSAQAALLTRLFSGPSASAGRGHPVTAVGDPRQAIYGWRGAAASNILSFCETFLQADGAPAHSYPLSTNRRSGQEILDLANRVASTLAADDGDAATVELTAPADAEPSEVIAATFHTFDEETAWLADRVVDDHRLGRAHGWSDIAVLVRRNTEVVPVVSALAERDVPVELGGLGGLLDLPGIRDVVDTLTLLADVRANPCVVRLLSGPRWRIGARDLAVLGARAQALSRPRTESPVAGAGPDAALEEVLREAEPGDLTCLLDAIDDPADAPLSASARERVTAFARELRGLRSHAAESPLELTHRVVRTIGLDVEALARPGRAGWALSDQVTALIDAVAAYTDVDGDDSLNGLLAWFDAERRFGEGLDQSLPGASDAVRVMTVHRAKGLEWDVVYLPALMEGVFPTDRSETDWVANSQALPAPLRGDADSIPQVFDVTKDGLAEYHAALKGTASSAEDRLAYVAITRARRRLIVTGHTWRADRARPLTASRYLRQALEIAEAAGTRGPVAGPPGDANPLESLSGAVAWPGGATRPEDSALADRVEGARARLRAGDLVPDPDLPPDARDVVAAWDRDITALISEALARRSGTIEVPLPPSLSASALMNALHDPDRFARTRLRPMPRPVSGGARRGSLFHEWVQRHYASEPTLFTAARLADPDDWTDLDDASQDTEVASLIDAFTASPWAGRTPEAVEQPFVLNLGGVQVRGRIDAVFTGERPGTWQVVDWKTSDAPADPVQLSVYRLAWAHLRGVAPDRVDALFWHVRSGRVQSPGRLLDEAELTAWCRDPRDGATPATAVPAIRGAGGRP